MNVQHIATHIAGERTQLESHRLYSLMTSTQNIARFMEYHVWAVWDFMSLLKALQKHLTCTAIPWVPVGDAETRFLINEIVVGEESDVNRHGARTSHFEMYLEAMREVGASTTAITAFIDHVVRGVPVADAMQLVGTPKAAQDFVLGTMDVIAGGKPHEIASVFTFGREEIIPTMFLGILDTLERNEGARYDDLRYYLERHVEVDGGHHGPLAERMVEVLCSSSERHYADAIVVAQRALQQRIALWDAVADACQERLLV
ncbi:MAG: DUF3050 domain-containing protein [Ignavibacteria bacterium]|jgi:hypothetical protein